MATRHYADGAPSVGDVRSATVIVNGLVAVLPTLSVARHVTVEVPNAKTLPAADLSHALANIGVTGMTPQQLATVLFDKCRVYTVAINTGPVKGVRVTPHLYTTTADRDALVKALADIARG